MQKIYLPVPLDDGAVAPVGILLVQLLNQMLHEDRHHALVRVRLREAEPDVAQLVDCGDHADPWSNRLFLYRLVLVLRFPIVLSHVSGAEPGLVHVNHVLVSVV